MSRIFDVMLKESGMYYVYSSRGHSRFRIEKYGVRGPNQILLPEYANPEEDEILTWSDIVEKATKVETNLDDVARTSHDKQLLAHVIEHTSQDLQVVRSNLNQYVEATNYYSSLPQILQIAPLPLAGSNKATYYLKLVATCSKKDFVTLQFGNGESLEINGEFHLYARDKGILNMLVRVPSRGKFRTSYSQILPAKDTILKLLSRVQYGQSSFQP